MHSFSRYQAHHLIGMIIGIFSLMLTTPQTTMAQSDSVGNTSYGKNALSSIVLSTIFYDQAQENSGFGDSALRFDKTGAHNTAVGMAALYSNISGDNNTANGAYALYSNTTGSMNTANGVYALYFNTSGSGNTANGFNVLASNTTGKENTAIGAYSLMGNTSGEHNTANGSHALESSSTGNENTATGEYALYSNTTGNYNTADGGYAIYSNTNGWGNTAIGYNSLSANSTGHNNIAVGNGAGANLKGSNNIDIASAGTQWDNNTIRIGDAPTKTFIAGISGVTVSGGVQVYINSDGQLGTLTSSQRFKKEIKSVDSDSDQLLQLHPVSFVYKDDDKNQLQYGLIAEEVAKIYPELVQYDREGNPFTVYYHLLTPLLLSELQKQHALNDARQTTLEAQQAKFESQQTELSNMNRQLKAQHAEMETILQRQRQQLADMTTLEEKLVQVDVLLQARINHQSSERMAMASGR